ncbi:ammonium transporter AmtB-like domain-containing protein [Desarmillaria tabescens]|uniref:Ammonium transporter AmtB-like domain-containing protein n=1 Tax=Armillaria tabescens TaxID=1929756 RepID=A0AA39J9L7_ARMTA|nr:ammonium transporter AmtB-like domain-containing protein [Desarmillaria tabescens]KAK0438711.1 ammonium transporter AmtB-like domain-containing protein [Desarmillaria tabescens]
MSHFHTLPFSETGSAFIGDLKYFSLKGVFSAPSMGSTCLPALIFCPYQLMFTAATPMIALGALAEHGSVYLGKRKGWGTERVMYKPHNATYVVLRVVFLWFGWFGFNGGSGLTWMLWDYCLERKWSVIGFCSGAIAGLVAITLTSGVQLADSVTGVAYTFVVTSVILWVMHWISGCQLHGSEEAEVSRLDEWDMGEFAYDYVGFEKGSDTDSVSGSLGEKGVEVSAVPAY